ncbi:glycosyltransferase family 2 protein [Nitrosarchaeum sp.]|uniref:glycosyltransferase family 2 protein n=1 Tax=Nitrosarchaeum sp. TaxID=2026886 RepID=UPI00247EBBDB|nr:glycosyltransferase family 2 protein [Nitrosarchaeum sp.]MCV0411930.1 glycosyltransferase family 2 protein [Nitrosarchaeum sp.]
MTTIVGIPAYNEEKNIAKIILQLKKIVDIIIVCDDGSSDLTGEIAKEMGANVIKHEKNLGYGSAIRSIFDKSKEIGGDILITFDADGQHRVEDIAKVTQPILNNEADIVIGSRFLDSSENIPKYRKVGIKAITGLTNITAGTKISDSQSGFRAYSKDVIEKINLTEIGMGVSTEVLIKAAKQNLRISEVPIRVLYEGDTSTHNPVSHGTSVILSTIKYVAMERPLSFYGIPGMIFLGIGLFFGVWTLQIFSYERQVITNIALPSVGGVIIGVILLVTATILHSMVSIIREKR